MVGVQQVVVSPRYPGLKIAILAETLSESIQLGRDLSMNDPNCYVYNPQRSYYELSDGVIMQCFGLNDLQKLCGHDFDQVFVYGYRALPSEIAHSLLRNSWVPKKFKLQFIKE